VPRVFGQVARSTLQHVPDGVLDGLDCIVNPDCRLTRRFARCRLCRRPDRQVSRWPYAPGHRLEPAVSGPAGVLSIRPGLGPSLRSKASRDQNTRPCSARPRQRERPRARPHAVGDADWGVKGTLHNADIRPLLQWSRIAGALTSSSRTRLGGAAGGRRHSGSVRGCSVGVQSSARTLSGSGSGSRLACPGPQLGL
jgi:hypothetical protein